MSDDPNQALLAFVDGLVSASDAAPPVPAAGPAPAVSAPVPAVSAPVTATVPAPAVSAPVPAVSAPVNTMQDQVSQNRFQELSAQSWKPLAILQLW